MKVAAMDRSLAIEKALQSFASQRSVINKAMAAMARPSAIEKALKIFSESSSLFMTDSRYFSAMAESISVIDNEMDLSGDESDFDESSQQLCEVKDSKSFTKLFLNLPPLFQVFLFFLFIHIFLPQVNNISSNLLTPIVKSYLVGNYTVEREKIKHIKKLPLVLGDVVTDDLRVITGNNVRLRQAPSTKSAILDELAIGQ
jgi:hypothetical protein